MPKYDLAGNPLPESGSTPSPSAYPPPAGLPPRADAQGRPFHAVPPPGAAPAPTVRYDLAGNPLPDTAPPPPPAGNWTPAPQPGTWPPPPAGASGYANPYGAPGASNTSGEHGAVPPEIAALKWNWGAFVLTWIWCLNHRMIGWGIGILVGGIVAGILPGGGVLVALIAGIYFGLNGHKLGWQNRRFTGVSEFMAVESAWMKWGVGIMILNLVVTPILAAILFPVFARARMKARMMNQSGYTQPYGNVPGSGGGNAGGGQ